MHNKTVIFSLGLCDIRFLSIEFTISCKRFSNYEKLGKAQSQLGRQPVAKSASQSFSRSIIQSVGRSIGHDLLNDRLTVCRWVNRTVSLSVSHSVGQSFGQLVSQCVCDCGTEKSIAFFSCGYAAM